MRSLFRLAGLLLALAVFQLTSCTTERYALATDTRVDSALVAAGVPPLAVRKLKFNGPVTFQLGQGNTSTTTGTNKTGQRTQAMSTGDNSPNTARAEKGGVPWWVFAIVAVVGAAGWQWLRTKYNPLGWLPWRAKVS